MSAPDCSPSRPKRVLASGLASSLALVGLGVAAPTARAETGSVDYVCTTPLGAATFSVNTDTTAGAKIHAGDTFATFSAIAMPADLAKAASDHLGAVSFSGSLTIGVIDAPVSDALVLEVPSTSLGDQVTAAAVPFTATGTHALMAPGPHVLRQGDIQVRLDLAKADGTNIEWAVSCQQARGPAPTIDAVAVVARSMTALTLSRGDAAYGQEVTATAFVTTSAGVPDGNVAFSINGVATMTRLAEDGTATLILPVLPVGRAPAVSATFVPRDTAHYETSTSPAAALTVRKARTRTRVSTRGKRTGRRTTVTAEVATQFDTVATGKVRVVLRKMGTRTKKGRNLRLVDGRRTANFGRLGRGRWKVVIRYSGDRSHMKGPREVRTFRVRRR